MFKLTNNLLSTLKIIGLLILSCLMLLPLSILKNKVYERESRSQLVSNEISNNWGNDQNIIGPLLVIPCKTTKISKDGEFNSQIRNAIFLPNKLNITSSIYPEIRYRSIFEVIVYSSNIDMTGNFTFPNFEQIKQKFPSSKFEILWNSAFIALSINDIKGIKKYPKITWLDKKLKIKPSVGFKTNIKGFNSQVSTLNKNIKIYPFNIKIHLNGSKKFQLSPIGKLNTFIINSPWKHPSFSGAYLPTKRKIGPHGFSANWVITNISRNYPQQFTDVDLNDSNLDSAIYNSQCGVTFIKPVNEYRKVLRSINYAFLFISLTFMTYFLFETIKGFRLHFFQYGLIGLSLISFFLILSALSEHLNFGISYLIASIIVILQIILYSLKLLKTKKELCIIFALLGLLYSYLYLTLNLEDYAFLVGAISLSSMLSIIMYVSRDINWFKITRKN